MNIIRYKQILTISVTLLGMALYSCIFIVMDYQAAIVSQFGKPVQKINSGGIYFKMPWPFETVHFIDKRLNLVEARIVETITRDSRNFIAPVFAIWRVTDAGKFFESLGSTEQAAKKLENILIEAKNTAIMKRDFSQIFSGDENSNLIDLIELEIQDAVNSITQKIFGITVLEVGLLQLTLPASHIEAVFERMRAERTRAASQLRSEAINRASQIRSKAEAERTEILAKAEAEAAAIRGQGDAESIRILREAYEKNPGLFEFVRELEVLEKVVSPDTLLILGTDSPPFRKITQDPEAR